MCALQFTLQNEAFQSTSHQFVLPHTFSHLAPGHLIFQNTCVHTQVHITYMKCKTNNKYEERLCFNRIMKSTTVPFSRIMALQHRQCSLYKKKGEKKGKAVCVRKKMAQFHRHDRVIFCTVQLQTQWRVSEWQKNGSLERAALSSGFSPLVDSRMDLGGPVFVIIISQHNLHRTSESGRLGRWRVMRHYLCVQLCVFELTRLCTLPVSTVCVCGYVYVCTQAGKAVCLRRRSTLAGLSAGFMAGPLRG